MLAELEHGWTFEDPRGFIEAFGRSSQLKTEERRRELTSHKLFECPIEGCIHKSKRLDTLLRHLLTQHTKYEITNYLISLFEAKHAFTQDLLHHQRQTIH